MRGDVKQYIFLGPIFYLNPKMFYYYYLNFCNQPLDCLFKSYPFKLLIRWQFSKKIKSYSYFWWKKALIPCFRSEFKLPLRNLLEPTLTFISRLTYSRGLKKESFFKIKIPFLPFSKGSTHHHLKKFIRPFFLVPVKICLLLWILLQC